MVYRVSYVGLARDDWSTSLVGLLTHKQTRIHGDTHAPALTPVSAYIAYINISTCIHL